MNFIANQLNKVIQKPKISKYFFSSTIPKTQMGKVVQMNVKDITPKQVDFLKSEISKYAVVVVKGSELDPREITQFAKKMGRAVVLPPAFANNSQDQNYPEVVKVTNVKKDETIDGNYEFGAYWHQDGNFRGGNKIYLLNALHCKISPKIGGNTAFIDLRRSYKILPQWLRKFFDQAQFKLDPSKIPDFKNSTTQQFGEVIHNCVQTHLVNKQKFIYLLSAHVSDYVGYPKKFSQQLTRYVFNLLQSDPDNVYIHKWTAGDMLLWDNTLCSHKALGGYGTQIRSMYRVQSFLF